MTAPPGRKLIGAVVASKSADLAEYQLISIGLFLHRGNNHSMLGCLYLYCFSLVQGLPGPSGEKGEPGMKGDRGIDVSCNSSD